MVQNSAIWSENFFDCKDEEQLRLTVRKNSPKAELRVNCTFNHRQLGYSDAWLKNAIEEANVTGEDMDRDFGNVWTSGSQSSPLPVNLSTLIRNSQVNECHITISSPYGYATRWYVPEEKIAYTMDSDHHILSVDSSDAVGGDDIALKLRSVRTGATVACGNYNETNLITFSEWLCSWLVDYRKVTLIIERRSTGAMILDYLLLMLPSKGIDPFKRIYNKVVQDADEDPGRFKSIDRAIYTRDERIYIEHKKAFGFSTSATGATSRSELYSTTLLNAAKLTGDSVKDPKTIDQILSLIIRNGRVDHPPGGNDDLVVAWVLSFWLLSHGKNLHFYGIDSKSILADNQAKNKDVTPITLYDSYEQDRVRRDVEKLVESLKHEKDAYVIRMLESKLRDLALKLNESDQRHLSIDSLIDSLKKQRGQNIKQMFSRHY